MASWEKETEVRWEVQPGRVPRVIKTFPWASFRQFWAIHVWDMDYEKQQLLTYGIDNMELYVAHDEPHRASSPQVAYLRLGGQPDLDRLTGLDARDNEVFTDLCIMTSHSAPSTSILTKLTVLGLSLKNSSRLVVSTWTRLRQPCLNKLCPPALFGVRYSMAFPVLSITALFTRITFFKPFSFKLRFKSQKLKGSGSKA